MKIFPFLVTKKKLKFYYLYCSKEDGRMSVEAAVKAFAYIYLDNGTDERSQILKMVSSIMSFKCKTTK